MRKAAEGKPVEIGLLQRYATDCAVRAAAGSPSSARAPTGKRVAVVGAGPAGPVLRPSPRHARPRRHRLRGARPSRAASTSTASPPTRRRTTSPQREVDFILSIGGIDDRHGRRSAATSRSPTCGATTTPSSSASGLGGVNALGLDGEDARRRRWTRSTTSRGCARRADLATLPVGRRVVVIGGGKTAIDIAVQSKRLGAEDVTIVYRRGPEQMSATDYEQELAQTNGVPHPATGRGRCACSATSGRVRGVELRVHQREDGGRLVGTGETLHARRRHGVQGDRPDLRAGSASTDAAGCSSSRTAGSRSMPSAAPRCRASGRAATASPAARTSRSPPSRTASRRRSSIDRALQRPRRRG